VPDALLFADAEQKATANRERQSPARYRHGIAIVENKAWDMPLDRGPPDLFNQNAPSTQMLRYLTRVEIESERSIQWGILTNGRLWRLYFQGARSRAEEFLELDLALLAGVSGIELDLFSPDDQTRAHLLKVFYLMFRRVAFLPSADDARSFHYQALDLTREWEVRVSHNLSEVVFGDVFPRLVNALADSDPKASRRRTPDYLDEVRQVALTLLYRLLFVLYAEDRNLLPSHDTGYSDYSLRKIRQELRDRIDRSERFSARADTLYKRLQTVFRLIEGGDTAIGLPPYNGGLFDDRYQPLLARAQLPDSELAPILDALSRRREGETRKWINYRDLSVQHLGSIYERLLEFLVISKDDRIVVQLNPFARKGSGSYYTHEDLVHLILERTIGPLVDERLNAFRERAAALASEHTPKAQRLKELEILDPATRLLDLKICDPAMGSGHFLVSLVDYLADEILEGMAESTAVVNWADPDRPYVSPLAIRVADIRARILEAADREGWHVERAQLDDRHIIRRIILKRVVYGVDKNPMAVELAKVALWLHTFTVGAPLSFLNHHLRDGDSLFGERVGHVMTTSRGALLINRYVQQAKQATVGMLRVEQATDADITEVRASGEAFAGVSADTSGLAAYLDFVHALRWLGIEDKDDEKLVQSLLDGQFGDVVKLIAGNVTPIVDDGAGSQETLFAKSAIQQEFGTVPKIGARNWDRLGRILSRARALARRERFLHWEVAFPGVWSDWESISPHGGFDAIIGNPPWDRIKLQEVEWFATRRRDIAQAVRAADGSDAVLPFPRLLVGHRGELPVLRVDVRRSVLFASVPASRAGARAARRRAATGYLDRHPNCIRANWRHSCQPDRRTAARRRRGIPAGGRVCLDRHDCSTRPRLWQARRTAHLRRRRGFHGDARCAKCHLGCGRGKRGRRGVRHLQYAALSRGGVRNRGPRRRVCWDRKLRLPRGVQCRVRPSDRRFRGLVAPGRGRRDVAAQPPRRTLTTSRGEGVRQTKTREVSAHGMNGRW
jgi:hypothetical protein